MSRSLNQKLWLAGIIAVFAVGFTYLKSAVERHEPGERAIASETPFGFPKDMGKAHMLMTVSLRAMNEATGDEEPVTLSGSIRVAQKLSQGLQFRWELPPGVQVIEGDLHGVFDQTEADGVYPVQITVRGFSREDYKLISLNGFIGEGDARMGHAAVVTSRPQDSYDMLAKTSVNAESLPQGRTLSGKIVR